MASVLRRLRRSGLFSLSKGPGGTPIQKRVCAAQRGRDFEAPDLEWGIHFRGVF